MFLFLNVLLKVETTFSGGPRIVESPGQNIVIINGRNIDLQCYATTDEMLDIAYMWTHNGLRIRDLDIINSNDRIVREFKFVSSTR